MRKLLWVGDVACGSGFAKATENTLEVLRQSWDIEVLGINYRGDPHDLPYRIYPAWVGGDAGGVKRLKDLIDRRRPDLIVLQANPWNVPAYQQALKAAGHDNIPVVGSIAVEGKNCVGKDLNGLKRALFWCRFGLDEARIGGMTCPAGIVPLGVDRDVFSPGDRIEARHKLGLGAVPDDAFIVTNVNRNQHRKRIDLSILYFAEWIKTRGIRDAYLHLHVLPGSSQHVNCDQLGGYCGISDRVILAEPRDVFRGAPIEYVVATYRAGNLGLSTSLCEGWGLTTMEGLSCGIPQIVVDYAAIPEWAGDAVHKVAPCSEGVMPDVRTMIGAVMDKQETIRALDDFYRGSVMRENYAQRGIECVSRPEFRWANIGQRFAEEIEVALSHA